MSDDDVTLIIISLVGTASAVSSFSMTHTWNSQFAVTTSTEYTNLKTGVVNLVSYFLCDFVNLNIMLINYAVDYLVMLNLHKQYEIFFICSI